MYNVFGFYKFKKLTFLKKKKIILQNLLKRLHIRGTIIISKEGLNGTISGKSKNLNFTKKKIKSLLKINNFDSENISKNKFHPFQKPKIKIKEEVVPMGIYVSSKNKNNNHLDPKEWNKFIKNKGTVVLDARKPFEYDVGTFKRAVNPKVKHFREFPKYLNKLNKKKSIAMFCTGGIRCEKASIYLEQKGFKNIFQLKGGILNYLKKIKKKNSLWKGECFVFDNRVSVKHNLIVGTYGICSGCRSPISLNDKKSKKYEEGVSCPQCKDKLTSDQISRFRMRQKQIDFAKRSGRKHIFRKEF